MCHCCLTFVFWDNYRFIGSCKARCRQVPFTLCPVFLDPQGCPSCMRPRMAVNAARHKIIDFLKTLWDFFVWLCVTRYLMCGRSQLFFQCGPETPKVARPWRSNILQKHSSVCVCVVLWQFIIRVDMTSLTTTSAEIQTSPITAEISPLCYLPPPQHPELPATTSLFSIFIVLVVCVLGELIM